jgi:hypothetical protein
MSNNLNQGASIEAERAARDADKFWRENVRPGTTFGPYSRQPTIWQRFYDWITRRNDE